MQFTILGASGFIGTQLTKHLRSLGHEVFTPSKGDDDVFEKELGRVIYAIGLTADFRTKPYETTEAHVCFLAKILQKANFVSITYLSSARVYQGADSGAENAKLSVNADADGLYNLTKLTGEALCLQSGRGLIVRLTNIVGVSASDSFMAQVIKQVKIGNLRLRSSIESSKDYLLIDDAVNALTAVAIHGTPGIYNIGSGINISILEIIDALSVQVKFETFISDGATVFSFPIIETTRIAELLCWQPKSVAQWLRETKLCLWK